MTTSILRLRLFLITVLLTTALLWPNLTASQMALPAKAASPVPLIIDTDIYDGLDDAGALAVAHSLMNKGEANLLGVVVDTNNSYSARCVDAINTYYNRPDIPIGINYPVNDNPPNSNYIPDCAAFPEDLQNAGTIPTALSVYRRLLAAQPDGSVVIVSIGFMGRLSELLNSPADSYSALTGKDLVTQKVKTLVVMGGDYPTNTWETNFSNDPASAANVVSHWPTKIVFSGYDLGFNVMTGSSLSSTTPASNPVRRSYEVEAGAGNSHRSYDLTAVYHAIRPDDPVMTEVGPGTNTVNSSTGANTFVSGAGNHYYLQADSNSAVASALEPLLAGSSQCVPLLVTNSSDDAQAGTCGTFSYALKEATLSNQAVSVTFNPGLSGVTLAGPLGPVSNPRQMAMTIDGGCQNQNIPGVRLQAGANAAAIGLRLTNLTTVKCLSIVGFSDYAISVEGNNNQVISSWLGTLDGHSGTSPGGGIRINGSNNSLGLAGQAASGNLIFGNNSYAVQVVSGQGNKSYYNTISLHNLGNIALPPAIRALSVEAGGQLKFGPGNHITSP